MNILMMTNTFAPHVGGVARSAESFAAEYRRHGHRVLVVAPEFDDMPENETDVFRIPAIQKFNGSDFSVALPLSASLGAAVERFKPEVVHSHHPFLLGATALRVARAHGLPLVFTHHTMYERYTHYVPGDSEALRRFVVELSTSYANLCDHVFAPSESVAEVLRRRGVRVPVTVVPTGVDLARFAQGSGPGLRAAMGIPNDAFLVGHVGRLAAEKNLDFLAHAAGGLLARRPEARFLLVGKGPAEKSVAKTLGRLGVADRLHAAGILTGPLLASAYRAMDVFAFASTSETQGMVLTEAMAAGVPVVALDAPGAREVVRDRENGRLLSAQDAATFVDALEWVAELDPAAREAMHRAVADTAAAFAMERCADRALSIYDGLAAGRAEAGHDAYNSWTGAMRMIRAEWDLLRGIAIGPPPAQGGSARPSR